MPTRLVPQILKPRSANSEAISARDEDASTTMAVMLRVQDPPRSLLMITGEHRERLRLALHDVGFKVSIASTKEHALELISGRRHALAVTDSLEIMKCLHDLGTARLVQIILITGMRGSEMEAALRARADECLDASASAVLLQARFTAAQRAGDLRSALRDPHFAPRSSKAPASPRLTSSPVSPTAGSSQVTILGKSRGRRAMAIPLRLRCVT